MCRLSRLFAVLFVLAMLFTRPVVAQERMRIAWAGSTPSNTPIWVADQKGFFKKMVVDAVLLLDEDLNEKMIGMKKFQVVH